MTMVLTQEAPPEYTQPGTDPLAAWLDAHTVTGEDLVIEKEALLEAYNAQGPALLPLSDRAFGQALARLRPAVKPGRRRNFGGKALAQVYLGIALGTPEAKPAGGRDQSVCRQTQSNADNNSTTLPVALIDPNPYQPRSSFDPQRLEELAASLKAHGLIQPVVVRPHAGAREAGGGSNRFELLAGERRLRAAKLAGLVEIPAVIRTDVDNRAAAEIALIENLQRDDLSAMDAARGYQGLRDLGYTQERIGERVGLSRESVANALRLLRLPADVQERIERRELSPSHGLAILRFDGFPAVMSAVAQRAAKSNTPSQDLERGFPYGYELQQAGIIRGVDSYYAPFDIAICKRCPFNAYRSGGPNNPSSGYCLKPEHWQELADAATTERKAQAAALTAQALESGGEVTRAKIEQALATAKAEDGQEASQQVLDLSKLPYNAYVRLRERDTGRPPGCTDQCPCFVVAMDGGRLAKACLDPKRHERLAGAEAKAAKKALKEHFDSLLVQVRQEPPSEREQVDRRRRALAQIVWDALRGASIASKRAAAADYPDPDLVALLSEPQSYSVHVDDGKRAWPILARQRPEDLVDLAAEILIREEHRDRLEYRNRDAARTAWYLTGAALPEAPEQPALAAPELTATCARCGTLLVSDGPLCQSCGMVDGQPLPPEVVAEWAAVQAALQEGVAEVPEASAAAVAVGTLLAWDEDGQERRGVVTGLNHGSSSGLQKYVVSGGDWTTVISAAQEGLRVLERK